MTRLLFCLALLSGTAFCQAATVCVFDMAGTQGPVMNLLKEYALAARQQGISLTLRAYTDERVAAEDFKANQCDGVLVSGVRARQFTPFAGSIDSVGALPDYPSLKTLLQTLARPEAGALLEHGSYETAGILPLGAAYSSYATGKSTAWPKWRESAWPFWNMTVHNCAWPNASVRRPSRPTFPPLPASSTTAWWM